MKVLVTGGAGFIGSHLVEKLSEENCQVMVLDNLHTGLRENVPAGVALVELNVCDPQLLPLFETEKFDAVVHLAGQTMVNVSIDDPHYDAQVNIQGTVNVLEACRKTEVKRIVFASTAAVYGDIDEVPIQETLIARPTSFYGLSKLTVENYLQLYHQLYGLDYVALRFANVYGERQGDGGEGGVISIFTKRVARGEAIAIYGDGGQTRDFIYAGDVASGIWQALRTEKANAVYNLSTQTEVSINHMVALLAQISGKSIQPDYGPVRAGDIYRSILANDRAVAGLAWKPVVSLKEGLTRTYRYFAQ